MAPADVEQRFVSWLKARGTTLHPSVGFHDFSSSNQGRGAIALEDIPKDTILFSLRRPPADGSPLLTIGTSDLPTTLGEQDWDKLMGKKASWTGLILCMAWEEARSQDPALPVEQGWGPYFDIMPMSFDTLMFWSDSELAELQASTVKEKLGREDVERDYREVVVPLVQARPDVFKAPASSGLQPLDWYSLERYHRMGSLILSRSFNVEADPTRTEPDDGDPDDADGFGDVSREENASTSAMEIDRGEGPSETQVNGNENDSDSDGEDEDREPVSDVAMVPMSDILNAKSGCENAKLFYEVDSLNMVSTKPIKAGEQIYNTYADPPNSDLLRRYGHVDDENPFDEVEVRLELCISRLAEIQSAIDVERLRERAIWLTEMGLEESFFFSRPPPPPEAPLPQDFISALRTLLASDVDFAKMIDKEKPAKPKADEATLHAAVQIFEARLAEYATSIEDDKALLQQAGLPLRRRQAIIVRLGEKRILRDVKAAVAKASAPKRPRKGDEPAHPSKKRKQ